jgi:hypothetical protein
MEDGCINRIEAGFAVAWDQVQTDHLFFGCREAQAFAIGMPPFLEYCYSDTSMAFVALPISPVTKQVS